MSLTMGYHGPLADLLYPECVCESTFLWDLHMPDEDTLWPVAAILCTGGPDVIRKEAWPFYKTISGVRLCWELEEPKGPNLV